MNNVYSSLAEMEYVCKLASESYKFPVVVVNEKGEPSIGLAPLAEAGEEAAYEVLHHLLMDTESEVYQSTLPLIHRLAGGESFLTIRLQNGSDFLGHVMMGPVRLLEANNESDGEAAVQNRSASTSVVGKTSLLQAGMLIHYSIYRQQLDIADVHLQNMRTEMIHTDEQLIRSLAVSRQNFDLHHNYRYEKQMLQFIREGHEHEMLHWAEVQRREAKYGTLSRKSPLRNQKNLGICGITLYTRAAIEGGMEEETAFTLSDLYIQQIEEQTTSGEVQKLLDHAMMDFTRRVRENRELPFSKPVVECRRYIFSHIYDDLSLQKLGEATGLHPGYLSRRFKKEVGTGLTDYIRQERVEEAKRLLRLSDYSLSDICSLLNFNDQSYFTKAFKKVTGITPGQYRSGMSPLAP
ncbi:helix-turn-helix domain-containing protein [Paenibacillus sp. JX-17]|uniref:Helix-turn-helix domain-containing protein n=1 Tax=Paenibacillus lacisoli TaxID=3064525 RepID=A0ABT9C8D3_9BACL|nr:helix-turn-helix domain-containing protein [Paenibacillus sp. JX-17]MDO7905522.1 helix-turn-helix domain-containing protein [Paenibacillus sp. JX-17]